MDTSSSEPARRLAALLAYLDADPDNLSLLVDAAEAALNAREPQRSLDLLDHHLAIAPLPDRALSIAGLAAMKLGDFVRAGAHFSEALLAHRADSALRFNLAWCLAMQKHRQQALALLDRATTDALPQAAMLEVQLLHDAGEFDEATERARLHLNRHGEHNGLLAVTSVLALDVDDLDLAAACAGRAGEHPDALTTLGTLALDREEPNDALGFFDRALAREFNNARAWVGRGLARLAGGDTTGQAAQDIERGAAIFGQHSGSWIAAGWAHLVSNDYGSARQCFETALALDRNFAETHGSLAALAILEGRSDEGRALMKTAQRLDQQSFSALLAQALLLQQDNKVETARALMTRALNTPINKNGKTLNDAIMRLGLSR